MDLLPELSPNLQRIVSVIGDTADAAFVVSLDCQFLAWGWRAQKVFGFGSPEMLGRYCFDVLPARDACGQCLCSVNCPMVTAARYGQSIPPKDVQIIAKDNRPLWVRVSPIVLRTLNGTTCAILVLVTDVSKFKYTEEALCVIANRLGGKGMSQPLQPQEGAALLRGRIPQLTPREAEVLWEAIAGDDHNEIAHALNIHPTTARNHLQRILQKLDVHSQRQAVLKAVLAIVSPPTPL
jgi:PAS domain S-box-containing protein